MGRGQPATPRRPAAAPALPDSAWRTWTVDVEGRLLSALHPLEGPWPDRGSPSASCDADHVAGLCEHGYCGFYAVSEPETAFVWGSPSPLRVLSRVAPEGSVRVRSDGYLGAVRAERLRLLELYVHPCDVELAAALQARYGVPAASWAGIPGAPQDPPGPPWSELRDISCVLLEQRARLHAAETLERAWDRFAEVIDRARRPSLEDLFRSPAFLTQVHALEAGMIERSIKARGLLPLAADDAQRLAAPLATLFTERPEAMLHPDPQDIVGSGFAERSRRLIALSRATLDLPAAELHAVIAHEAAHLDRRDDLLRLACAALQQALLRSDRDAPRFFWVMPGSPLDADLRSSLALPIATALSVIIYEQEMRADQAATERTDARNLISLLRRVRQLGQGEDETTSSAEASGHPTLGARIDLLEDLLRHRERAAPAQRS